MNASAPKIRAEQTASTFRMQCSVETTIQASRSRIWALLTNAEDFPRWNSTVSSIEGTIALGNKLTLRVPISDRAFSPKVTAFVEAEHMEWSDGFAPMFRGVRTFVLREDDGGSTHFSMSETFSGLMLPMIKSSLPDFGPPFEQYAKDLKREAESAR